MMRRRHIISNTKFIADWSHTIHEITTPRKGGHLTHQSTPPPGGQIDPDLRAKYNTDSPDWLVVAVSPRKSQVGDQFKFHNSVKDESLAWGIGESTENFFAQTLESTETHGVLVMRTLLGGGGGGGGGGGVLTIWRLL